MVLSGSEVEDDENQKFTYSLINTSRQFHCTKKEFLEKFKKNIMDEIGIEPMTFRMQSERATNCATRP